MTAEELDRLKELAHEPQFLLATDRELLKQAVVELQYVKDVAAENEGMRRYLRGEPLKYSTGIAADELTWGYGELDGNGYWQFTLPLDLLREEDRETIRKVSSGRKDAH